MIELLGSKLYSTSDLANLLGVQVGTISYYAKKSKVEGRRISRSKYYTEDDIKRMLLLSETGNGTNFK